MNHSPLRFQPIRLQPKRYQSERETYRATRKEYRQKLRSFLDQTEADRIRKLCHAAESNEKLFWKLIKSQRSSSQISAFLVNGDLLTDKKAIRARYVGRSFRSTWHSI